jgi:hypothetical protein
MTGERAGLPAYLDAAPLHRSADIGRKQLDPL